MHNHHSHRIINHPAALSILQLLQGCTVRTCDGQVWCLARLCAGLCCACLRRRCHLPGLRSGAQVADLQARISTGKSADSKNSSLGSVLAGLSPCFQQCAEVLIALSWHAHSLDTVQLCRQHGACAAARQASVGCVGDKRIVTSKLGIGNSCAGMLTAVLVCPAVHSHLM
jgi:hypothetical protein